MALARATILLARSSACVIGGESHLYFRYLSTAAQRSHIITIPTSISSCRQFSSSPCMKPTSDSNDSSVNHNQQSNLRDLVTVGDLLSQLHSMNKELESLRKDKLDRSSVGKAKVEEVEAKKEKVVVVKEKDPLLKTLESEMLKADISRQLNTLPDGFKLVCDEPGENTVTFDLQVTPMKEIISLQLKKSDDSSRTLLIVVVSSSNFFSTKARIHCTITKNGYRIDNIQDPTRDERYYCPRIQFRQLPEDLQREFYNYLEIRGIDSSSTKFLYEYTANKINRQNLSELKMFSEIL